MSGSSKSKMKKGVYFTIDALLGAGIMLTALALISSSYISETVPPSNSFAADDLLMALSNLKVSEANSSYVKSLISSGDITKLNNTILEQIGEFWAEGNFDKARNISKEFIQDYTSSNVGVGFFISGEEIFARNKTSYNTVISRKRLISGIQKNRTSDGYLARAVALKSKKNTTLVVAGDVITSSVEKSPSGNNFNEVNVTYDVFIPENSTILGSEWFIEAAWTGIDFDAYINGQYIGSATPSDNGRKNFQNLNSYLTLGHNNATVLFNFGNSNNPEGGDDGATHFIVNYTTSAVNTLTSLKRKNLAIVSSNASVRYKKPIFAAGDINSIDIYLNVTAENVSLNYTLDGANYFISKKNASGGNLTWSNGEIVAALANNGHSYSSLNNKYFWFVFDLDTYTLKTTKGKGRQMLPNSYVEVDFTPSSNIYGMIDITRIVPIYSFANECHTSSGEFYSNLTWQFSASNSTMPLMLDSQLAWLYQSGTDPFQKIWANKNVLYQHPPSPLVKEMARFGYVQGADNIVAGINNYSLGFSSDDYCVDYTNSLVTYTSLVTNYVGYGATFNSLQEAKDDASQRLSQVLGDFATATEINNDVITLSKVPSMWGPSIMEIRIWQ